MRTRQYVLSAFGITLAFLTAFPPIVLCQAAMGGRTTGTVNIIIANVNGLVAVTDSMLSSTNGVHTPIGLKLYKIDDQTICTMAGLYTQPGPALGRTQPTSEPDDNLFVRTPSLINYYKLKVSGTHHFAEKYATMVAIFQHDLSTSIQALEAENRLSNLDQYSIELTLAGYDEDGGLKIAAVELKPRRTDTGIGYVVQPLPLSPSVALCEEEIVDSAGVQYSDSSSGLPPIRSVGDELTCELAGLSRVSGEILAHPASFGALPAIARLQSRTKEKVPLTLEESTAVAMELEWQTALAEAVDRKQRVGGQPDVAKLSNGRVSEWPGSSDASPDTGAALHQLHVSEVEWRCDPAADIPYDKQAVSRQSQQQVKLTDCQVNIDRILFHDSSFVRGAVMYSGRGPLQFPDSNHVDGSYLLLGDQVQLDQPNIKHLMCAFPWKEIQQEQREQSSYHPGAPAWAIVRPPCR